MNKYLKYKLIGLAFVAVVIAGCDTASQEVEDPISPDGYPVATFTAETSATSFDEGDTIRYTIELDKQLDRSVTFTAKIIGGSATDDDFEIIPGVIAPFTSSATLEIIIVVDTDADPNETAEFEIGSFSLADKYLLNPTTTNPTMSFTIANYATEILEMSFSWDRDVMVNPGYADYPDHENTYHAGAWVDFDIFLADGAGYDNDDPWATFNAINYAATGSEPEEFNMEEFPNGTYVIFCELWYNGFADSTEFWSDGSVVEDVPMPITATFLQRGVQGVSIAQDPSQTFSTLDPGYDQAEWTGQVIDTYVAEVTVSDGTYVIKDFAGSTVLKGTTAGTKLQITKRPDSLRK
jgi:hypothetical protein